MWKKPRLARNAHYFEAGLSLCSLWNDWPRWLLRDRRETDRVCRDCYKALYERQIVRTQ